MFVRSCYARIRNFIHFLKSDKCANAGLFTVCLLGFYFKYPDLSLLELKYPDENIMQSCNSSTKTCTIKSNKGGFYLKFSNTYLLLYRKKYNIVVDGFCASSCTYLVNAMYLNNNDSVCITKNAVFGIHGAKVQNISNLSFSYIGELQELIDEHGGIPDTDKPLYLGYNDLSTVYYTCE